MRHVQVVWLGSVDAPKLFSIYDNSPAFTGREPPVENVIAEVLSFLEMSVTISIRGERSAIIYVNNALCSRHLRWQAVKLLPLISHFELLLESGRES